MPGVAVYTWNFHPDLIDSAIRKGASGYLSKTLPARDLVTALESIHGGATVINPMPGKSRAAPGLDWPGRSEGLTERESEILALITQGKSNAEVAVTTYLSVNSIKSYIRSVYRKIGVKTRTQAVLWGVEHGFKPDHDRLDLWRGDTWRACRPPRLPEPQPCSRVPGRTAPRFSFVPTSESLGRLSLPRLVLLNGPGWARCSASGSVPVNVMHGEYGAPPGACRARLASAERQLCVSVRERLAEGDGRSAPRMRHNEVWMDPVLLVVRSMSGQLEDRSILAQSVRRLFGVALLVPLAIATPACSSNGNKSGRVGLSRLAGGVVEERPVELSYRGPSQDVDALVARRTPRLVVQVTNSQPTVERVRLALDRKDALDVDLPPGGDCRGGHNPVFSVAYNHPPVGSTPNWTSRAPPAQPRSGCRKPGPHGRSSTFRANGHGETSPSTTPSPCGGDTTCIGPTPRSTATTRGAR